MSPPALPSDELMEVNGVELCVDTLGDRADPAILLVMGSGAAMDWWEDGFCERLAVGGRFVVRYDHRDAGQSVSYPPGDPGYARNDLADDAVGVLDGLASAPPIWWACRWAAGSRRSWRSTIPSG